MMPSPDLMIKIVNTCLEDQKIVLHNKDSVRLFLNKGKVNKIDAQQIIAVMQMICKAMDFICPFVNNV